MMLSSRGFLKPSATPCASLNSCKSRYRFGSGSQLPTRSAPFRRIAAKAATTAAAETERFPRWEFMYRDLCSKNVTSLSPEEAAEMVKDGKAVLVDVRMKEVHEKAHPEASVNAPIFQQMDMSQLSVGKVMKLVAMTANGVQPTEYNPKFVEQVRAAAVDGKAVILACEAGGTLQATTNFATGKTSRSLKGCWKAIQSGAISADKCYHLDGGVYRWFTAGLPMTGEYDTSNVGRTPNAVVDK